MSTFEIPTFNAGNAALANALPVIVYGNTVADIQAAIDSLPVGETQDLHYNHVVGGGGVVKLARGMVVVMTGSESIAIPPNVTVDLNGAVIDNQGDAPTFIRKGSSPYDGNGIGIHGPGTLLSTTHTAPNGIWFRRVVEASIQGPLMITGFTEDGIKLEQCQWVSFKDVNIIHCEGWGIWMGGSTDDGFNSNNNRCYNVFIQACGLGGVHIEDSHDNEFIGCTSQFHNGDDVGTGGPGFHVYGGDAQGNKWSGHLEGNPMHVYVQAVDPATATGRPRATEVRAFFVVSAVCERFVRDQGQGTTIIAPGYQNDSASMPTTNGTQAPFELYAGSSSGFQLIGAMALGSATALICFENGTPVNHAAAGSFQSGGLTLARGSALQSHLNTGALRTLASFDTSNIAQFGHASSPTRINGSQFGFNIAPVTRADYTAATGTASRATFATSTVTLEQLAERVKAIIDDLLAIGLFT